MPAAALPRSEERRVGTAGRLGGGATEALAPLGVPDTARMIVPADAIVVLVMVLDLLVRSTRLRLLGLAEIVKFGLGAVTVSCTVVGWVTDPSVPVTVSV